jgi:IS6 family transposase
MSTPALFKWRHFLPEIILLNVRWYCRYSLSYRDLEEMMRSLRRGRRPFDDQPMGAEVCPELDKLIRPYLKPTNNSWRVDETYIKIKGVWKYLYPCCRFPGQYVGLYAECQTRQQGSGTIFP